MSALMKKINYLLKFSVICLSLISCFFVPKDTHAYTVTDAGADIMGDFVLEPGKMEVFANPGDTITKYISVTDRIKGTNNFDISTEDFVGSDKIDQPVVLLGGDKSPYSFKDNIKADTSSFSMNGGQKATIPVTITVPKDAQPGGYYSAVIVSNTPNNPEQISGTKVISRVGVLFFVRVNGPVNASGTISDFRVDASKSNRLLGLIQSGPINFEILFKNTGSVYVIPSGNVIIKNIFGQQVANVPVEAYFSLPNSLRYREVTWPQHFLFGLYSATLTLNKGYDNAVETRSLHFLAIPWLYIGIVIGVALLFTILFHLFAGKFELRRKK
jgi:hypothetical protein